jgi:ERCC4-type nuclease
MIIKVDCRERDIFSLIDTENTDSDIATHSEANTSAGVDTDTDNTDSPKFYIMDLGDGVTIQVPIPKQITPKGKQSSMKTMSKSIEQSNLSHKKCGRHKVVSERLAIGDIAIMKDQSVSTNVDTIILFERKTLYDLAASIKDGRYKEQSFRLSNAEIHNHNIIYIIEGDLSRYDEKRGRISKTALQSAMVSLMFYKGFSVFRTMNATETASFIYNFANKVENDGETGYYTHGIGASTENQIEPEDTSGYCKVAVKKEKRDYITRDNIGGLMLSQIPGISPKIAVAIMKKYNNSICEFLADLKLKLNIYEDSISPPKSPVEDNNNNITLHISGLATCVNNEMNTEQINKNKLRIISECFKDIEVVGDNTGGKINTRGIGKATVEKIYRYLC